MKNLVLSYTVQVPVPGASGPRQPHEVIVHLGEVVPNYESLPDSEEMRCRLLLLGYLHLECDARIEGLWWELQGTLARSRAATLEPEARLVESNRLLDELRNRRRASNPNGP